MANNNVIQFPTKLEMLEQTLADAQELALQALGEIQVGDHRSNCELGAVADLVTCSLNLTTVIRMG